MPKFLITGCSGFVAEYFIEYLVNNCVDVDILGIASRKFFSVDSNKFVYKQVNMLERNVLQSVLKGYQPDYILHLASISSVAKSWDEPVESFQNNTNIFLNLVECVRQLHLKTRILSVGSSEVYATNTISKTLCEEDAISPSSPYAIARYAQELCAQLYVESYGLDIILTRSFNHTGPRQSDTFVIPSFVKRMVEISIGKSPPVLHVGNIQVERDFLDVRDVVAAYYLLLLNGTCGDIYNVCSGYGINLFDIIVLIKNKLNIEITVEVDSAKLRPNEVLSRVGDNQKLTRELHWSPRYRIEQTITDLVNFYRN